MRKNYSSATTTTSNFKGETKNGTFLKCADMVGKYDVDTVKVCGFIKSNKGKYGDSYSLAINKGGKDVFLNIPSWLGTKIESDFNAEGISADAYFDGACIAEVVKIETSNGNTYDIEFYI